MVGFGEAGQLCGESRVATLRGQTQDLSRATEPSQSELDKPGQPNTSRRTVSQDLRSPQGPPFGSCSWADEADSAQTGCRGWAGPGRLGVLGACAGYLCPPSRSLSICPLPASCFCFGATGTSSSHHSSKWLAGLSGKPGVGAGHPSPRDIHRGKGRATLWPGRGRPTEVHVVLPTMLLTRLPSSSHGASGVSTTPGQGAGSCGRDREPSLCPLPASDRGPRGALALPFFLGPWCTHTQTHTHIQWHTRHILTH